AVDTFEALGYKGKIPILLVVNQADNAAGMSKGGIEHTLNLPVVGEIPTDWKLVAESLNKQQPFVLSSPNAAVSKAIDALANALEAVRDEFGVPTSGVIRPGAAAALTATARRAVGVLATVLTVRSGAYVRALRDLDPLVDVAQQACPKLVPLVEDGKAESPEALAAVREYVEPLLTEGGVVRPVVDTLLLGCT